MGEVLRQEVKTVPALSVQQYSCSARTMALHTGELNARRCALQAEKYNVFRKRCVTCWGIWSCEALCALGFWLVRSRNTIKKIP